MELLFNLLMRHFTYRNYSICCSLCYVLLVVETKLVFECVAFSRNQLCKWRVHNVLCITICLDYQLDVIWAPPPTIILAIIVN